MAFLFGASNWPFKTIFWLILLISNDLINFKDMHVNKNTKTFLCEFMGYMYDDSDYQRQFEVVCCFTPHSKINTSPLRVKACTLWPLWSVIAFHYVWICTVPHLLYGGICTVPHLLYRGICAVPHLLYLCHICCTEGSALCHICCIEGSALCPHLLYLCHINCIENSALWLIWCTVPQLL